MSDPGPFAARAAVERRLVLAVVLPLLIAGLLAGALAWAVELMIDSARWVDHSDQVIAQARRVRTLLVDRETLLRGYLITGGDGNLAAYRAVQPQLDGALAELGRLIVDNEEQETARQRIVAQAGEWARAADPLIVLRARGGDWQSPDVHRSSIAAMDALRVLTAGFVGTEERLRDGRSQHASDVSRALISSALGVVILFGAGIGWFARRQLRAVAQEYEGAMVLSREQALLLSDEEKFRRLIEAIRDYAILQLDPHGAVSSWSAGAERATGWRASEIMSRHIDVLFTEKDRAAGLAAHELEVAAEQGVWRGETERVRKDGTTLLAEVILTAVRDSSGQLLGFTEVARDITEQRRNEAAIARLNGELEQRVAELAGANAELEAFSYSVSHDLRGPLRAIDGFSKILAEQYRERLDSQAQHYLNRVRAGSQRMGQLIDDLLSLSRINRSEMRRASIDLAPMAREIVAELRRQEGARQVEVRIDDPLPARGDGRLVHAALENLIGNAWKFTGRAAAPTIAVGSEWVDGARAFFVRDNGAGFDMAYVHKLFAPFQRLHEVREFEGTGIGLATVHRIVTRHGGRIWAESRVGHGATFWFTLGSAT